MAESRSQEPVTDVLAAEEFVVPAPDPALTPENLDLPADLVGSEPRDVLAAEEFAMPAPDEARVRRLSATGAGWLPLRLAALALAALISLWAWRRRLRHRRAG